MGPAVVTHDHTFLCLSAGQSSTTSSSSYRDSMGAAHFEHSADQGPGTPPPFPKDCKACSGAVHLMTSFQRMTGTHTSNTAAPPPGQPSSTSPILPAVALEAAAERLPCPPQTAELGRSTWTFLHTMAAYYPEEPSGSQRSLMRSMMEGLAEFYPCHYCAAHLKQQIEASPPAVNSGSQLSLWLCRIHNEVNDMLGKPMFDCTRAMERWRTGPADGSCG